MTTGPVHHRTKHRSRVRRLALPVVIGLTLVSLWTLAPAVEPSSSKGRIQPRIVDFATLAKQKAQARHLLDAARIAAANGDLETARHRANQAAALPIEWNLGEKTPARFLEELETNPQRYSDFGVEVLTAPIVDAPQKQSRQRRATDIPRPSPASVADREVIELVFPDDQPGTVENVEEELTLADTATPSKNKSSVPSPTPSQPASTTLRTLGFKTSDSDSIEPPLADDAPRSKQGFTPIPSIEDLANSVPVPKVPELPPASDVTKAFRKPKSNSTDRSRIHSIEEIPFLESSRVQGLAAEASSPMKNVVPTEVESQHVKSKTLFQAANDEPKIPRGRIDESDTVESSFRPAPREFESDARSMSPTTVIHEFRFAERAAPAGSAANLQSSTSSILLANLTGLLMAGLFGALLLLIVVAVVVLRKFGPNPQFTFKVDVNHSQTASALEPIAKATVRPLSIAPIYAQQRQLAEELELQQEDAMMRQVFDDNLKLREQLEESSIAA